MRIGDTEESLIVRRQVSDENSKRDGKGWYNSASQAEKGQIGGKIGGKKSSEAQQANRKEMGLKYGAKTGVSNQSPLMKVILNKELTYYHKSGLKVTFGPRESSLSIVKTLQTLGCSPKIKTPTTFSKMLVPDKIGLRRSLYGWSLLGIVDKTEKAYLNLVAPDFHVSKELPNLPVFSSLSFEAADLILAELKDRGIEQKKTLFQNKSPLSWKDVIELL